MCTILAQEYYYELYLKAPICISEGQMYYKNFEAMHKTEVINPFIALINGLFYHLIQTGKSMIHGRITDFIQSKENRSDILVPISLSVAELTIQVRRRLEMTVLALDAGHDLLIIIFVLSAMDPDISCKYIRPENPLIAR